MLHYIGAAFNKGSANALCSLTNSSSIIRSKSFEFTYENRLRRPLIDYFPIAFNYVYGPDSTAGSTTRKAPVATATPKPEPTAQPTAAPSTPVAPPRRPAGPVNVVMLNGQTLGTADFEPAVRQQLEQVEDKIAAAKREVLDLQINTILLQVEANRRRIDTHRLYETEVTKRIPVPTAAQIKKLLDQQGAQLEGTDPASANQQAAAYLQAESESKLADDLVNRLRKTRLAMGADINTPTSTKQWSQQSVVNL